MGEKIAPLEAQRNETVAEIGSTSNADGGTQENALELSLGLQWDVLDQILAEERAKRRELRGESEVADGQFEPVPTGTWATWLNGYYQTLIRTGVQGIGEHTRSVDGLAQAVLLMLFFSLPALKMFEPKAVRLYYSDDLQLKWTDYLRGAFDRVPGFTPGSNPATSMNHIEFASTFLDYRQDRVRPKLMRGMFLSRGLHRIGTVLPVLLPECVGAIQAQGKHVFGVVGGSTKRRGV